MPLKYNPLLKIGLDNTVNGSGDNSKKVSKFYYATDTLEDGEIAQYQGKDDLTNNLTNGFFYKQTGRQQELPAGTQFFNNIATTVNLYGYNVKPGNFYVKENLTPTTGNNFFNYNLYRFENFWNYQFLTLNDARPDVGDVLFDTNNNTIVTVLQVTFDSQFRTNYILSDGTTIVLTARTGHALNALYTFLDNDLNIYTIADCRELNSWVFLHYSLSDNTFNIIDWFTIPYELLQTTSEPVVIGNNVFQQTDSQPRYTLPVATPDVLGGVKIGKYLVNRDALTLNFSIFATGYDEIPVVDDNFFDVEIGSLWLHFFVFKVACVANFATFYHSISLPFNFLFNFRGYIYDINFVCIGHYSLSDTTLTIFKSDDNINFESMDAFTFIAFL